MQFGYGSDIFTVDMLLRAAGANLSAESDTTAHGLKSVRSVGLILLVTIMYDNFESNFPEYDYHVTKFPNSQYNVTELQSTNQTHRLYIDRHGIKVVFVQVGRIGRFNISVMILQLMSAFGLLAVAGVVVELLMLYLMPEKQAYTDFKFIETEDFSDVRDKSQAQPEIATAHVLQSDLQALRYANMDGWISTFVFLVIRFFLLHAIRLNAQGNKDLVGIANKDLGFIFQEFVQC